MRIQYPRGWPKICRKNRNFLPVAENIGRAEEQAAGTLKDKEQTGRQAAAERERKSGWHRK